MRYVTRTFFGFTLIVMSWVMLGYTLYQLLQIGTCASGGPYVSARQCPSGTGVLGLMIPAALILLGAGLAIYMGRGKAPGSDRSPNPGLLIALGWTGLFWSIAVGCLLGIYGPDAHPGPGAGTGGLIVAIIFIPMGAGGLFGLKAGGAKQLGMPNLGARFGSGSSGFEVDPGEARKLAEIFRQRAQTYSEPSGTGGDSLSRLESLSRMRKDGTLTEEEFERLKKQVLGES